MSSREAARRDELDGRGQRRRPGSSAARLPASGRLGKSSAGRVRRWKLEPPLRISTSRSASRSSISTSRVAERAGELGRAAGRAAGPSRRRSTSASSAVAQPHLDVGRRQRDAVLGSAEEDPREGLGRGASRNGSRDDRELGDELFAFGGQLQMSDVLLSWISACGNCGEQREFGCSRGFRAVEIGCGRRLILTVPSAVRPLRSARLWIAERSSPTRSGQRRVGR